MQYGGSPLYQACALDLPDATRLLLNHGASVVQVYKDQTPLQVALGNKDSSCVKVYTYPNIGPFFFSLFIGPPCRPLPCIPYCPKSGLLALVRKAHGSLAHRGPLTLVLRMWRRACRAGFVGLASHTRCRFRGLVFLRNNRRLVGKPAVLSPGAELCTS